MLLPSQSHQYPLSTTVTASELNAFKAVFPDGLARLDKAAVSATRLRLEPRARAGDAFAQYLYAKAFDLYGYGVGTPQDARISLMWYTKAADQKLALAEFFLVDLYRYSLMNQPTNLKAAAAYLNRAYTHSAGTLRSDVLLELARQVNPELSEERLPGFKPSLKQTRAYLEEALRIDPNNSSAVDWLFDLYSDASEYNKALKLADRSSNRSVWEQAGIFLKEGRPGLPANPVRAAEFFKRSLVSLDIRRYPDNLGEVYGFLDHLYEMECLGQIPRSSFKSLETKDSYKQYLLFRQGCRVVPGG